MKTELTMNSYVKEQVHKLAIENGADEKAANDSAQNAADEYARGVKYGTGKPLDLILHHVKMACNITGKKRVKANKSKPARAYRKKKDTADMFNE